MSGARPPVQNSDRLFRLKVVELMNAEKEKEEEEGEEEEEE